MHLFKIASSVHVCFAAVLGVEEQLLLLLRYFFSSLDARIVMSFEGECSEHVNGVDVVYFDLFYACSEI